MYSGSLPPDRFNLARHCLEAAARWTPDKPALIVASGKKDSIKLETLSFGGLQNAVLRLAAGLRTLELRAGDRVFLRLGNGADYALAFLAANAAGLVPIPASSQLSEAEVSAILVNSGARLLIHDGTLPVPCLHQSVRVVGAEEFNRIKQLEAQDYSDTAANDPAYLVYTSGTSGRPKGVLHAQRAVWGRKPMVDGWYGISADDILMHMGAFNWTYTLGTGLMDPWANGATSVVHVGEKDPRVWPELVRLTGATIMAGVPAAYRQILKYCTDEDLTGFASLRHGLCAGEALHDEIASAWRNRTGTRLCEAFGMSEISTFISTAPGDEPPAGATGRPQPGRAVAILDEDGGTTPLPAGETGVLAVHASDPAMMLRYWDGAQAALPCETMRDGWFLTGDLGKMDDGGWFHYGGRNDDLMNASGYRVAPQETERVLAACPGVTDVAVTEVKVRSDLSIIAAFVVTDRPVCADQIMQFAESRLAAYKRPKAIHFVDQLPRSANGKLLRKALRS